MKKVLISLLALAVAVAAFVLTSSPKAESQDPAANMTAPLPVVRVITIQPEEVTITQELNGRVTPFVIAEVRPQVNGIILERMFDEGSDVTRDMQLYQIDPAMYEAELMRAEATVAKARANVDVAEARLARYERLIEAKAVNKQEYDEVEATTLQARAEVGIAESEVRLARINVEYAKVRSPISGRIGKSSVTQGALVTASQVDPLAVVQQLDPIYVDVTQPISWMLNLKAEMQAGILQNTGESHAEMQVMLDDGEIYGQRGKLLFADVTVDQTTGSISLRAEFPNPNHLLLPGMFVRALFDVAQKNDAITVPQRAAMRDADGSLFVMVVNGDNSVERRKVKAVRSYEDKWLLESGLTVGEKVIIEGGQRLRFVPGQEAPKVNPEPYEGK